MGARGQMPVSCDWRSGVQYWYESAVGRSVTGDILSIGTTAVTIGGTSQDIDFGWYAASSKSFVLDAGAGTLTMAGVALSTAGAVTITNATATSSTTTGALIVTGGIATAADITCGDDLFMSSNGVINFASGDATITHDSADDQGKIRVDATINAGAISDGYGIFEVNLNMTGVFTGHAAAASAWANLASGVTVAAGNYCCARNDGVYEDAGATITNAKIIFGARMHKILGDTDALSFPHSLNTNNTAITALYDIPNLTDAGQVTNAGSDTGKLYPLFRDAGGTIHYVKAYTQA